MAEWRSSTWGEEISLEYGKALREYSDTPGRVRVYGTNGPVGWTDKALADGPGVILGRKGAYRGVKFSPDPFFVIDTAYFVVPKTELDMRWIYYAIIFYNLGKIDDGSPIPSTTRAAVYPRPLNVPSLQEQCAIAAVLGALDDKIEQNRRTSRALERLVRAIFRAWFVDFEPVKAKAAGAKSFPSMPQETFDTLPSRFVDSELGHVPAGWEVTRWGRIATLEYGKGLRGYAESSGPYRVFGTNGTIGRHTEHLADGPGIVIGRKGAYRGVHFSPGAFWAIDTAFYLKPKQSIDWKWAYYEILRTDINSMDSGSAIPSTSREDFYSIPVCVPSAGLFLAFDSIVEPLFNLRFAGGSQNNKLAELRDYLLPKLLSGTVRLNLVCETPDTDAGVQAAPGGVHRRQAPRARSLTKD